MLKFSNSVIPRFLGLIDYAKALEIQNNLHSVAVEKKESFVLGLEHPTVMTLGLRAHDLDLNSICTTSWNHPVYKISRGGLATIHNPGQLVIYPIFDLKKNGISVKNFVQLLFSATQMTLAEIGIESKIDLCQPGVYTKNGKIAFCGLHVKNSITLHGLSINIHNDISVFKSIQSCGITQPEIDSVARHGKKYSTEEFFNLWLKHFSYSPDLIKSETNSEAGCC